MIIWVALLQGYPVTDSSTLHKLTPPSGEETVNKSLLPELRGPSLSDQITSEEGEEVEEEEKE